MITVLTNSRLLDCVGDEPFEDASVVIEEGLIKDIYSGKKALPGEATVINVGDRTILPGLTDAHCHPAITKINIPEYLKDQPIITALQIKKNLEQMLQAGFTTVCDKGFANLALKQALEDEWIQGPRLLISCGMLSQTGGHADWTIPGVTYRDTGLLALPRLVDGVPEARKGAREQLRAGADQLKIMATGGGASPYDQLWHIQFSEDEIRAIVEEAEAVGKYVASHTTCIKGIKRAIKCGVRSIDHGVPMDEEAAQMLKEKDFFHVPTLAPLYLILREMEEFGMPDYMKKKATKELVTELMEAGMRAVELTYRAGCNVGSGTDSTGEQFCARAGVEIKLKTECGMTPYEAIKSATMVNARLFRMEDKIGSIEIGKWADIIVVEGHPDEDADLLAEPGNIKVVLKKGKIFKHKL